MGLQLGDSAGLASGDVSGRSNWAAVKSGRAQQRAELLASRSALAIAERRERGERAKARLLFEVYLRQFAVLGIYWPIRAEIDVRDIAIRHIEDGGRVALPVVTRRNAPVEFWQWEPGASMRRGFWNIPVPSSRRVLRPDALIVPLVGFDASCYRLGYGGGYYDRTLAELAPRVPCFGLGYADAELETIHPQPHDVPMSLIVTERDV